MVALIDRDGTIIVEKNYLKSVGEIEFLPNAISGLERLTSRGYGLIVISNQSGIGRGLLAVDEVEAIHSELTRRLREMGVELQGIYYCPHSPADDCDCRKPRIGLVTQALADHSFDPTECLVIGDKTSDIEFGRNIGAGRTVLVRTGYGREHEEKAHADFVADDLLDAALLL